MGIKNFFDVVVNVLVGVIYVISNDEDYGDC